jgi:6-phosphogluconolactonase/glucosamine-6-phosphate isomerase/deaminase
MIQLHHGPTQPLIHVLPQWAEQAAQMIADAIIRQTRQHGRCRLALTGSKQALPVYSALKRLLPTSVYSQLWLTWTDELVLPVPNDIQPGQWQQMDPHSHLYQSYEAWLAHVPVVTEQVLPLVLHGDGPQDVVRFGREFQSKFSGGVDIALFGLGSHGQIASYWPGHPAL